MILPPRHEAARKATRSLLSVQHWKSRVLLWTAGAAVGGTAVGFAWVADRAQSGFFYLLHLSRWWPWILTPAGFALIAWLTKRYFAGAEGSGIPQTMFALQTEGDSRRKLQLLRPHVVLGRVVLAAAGLLCGGSIGREGPTVHVGAVIAHTFARWMPHGGAAAQQRALVLAGGAAGVAAAFNTPLAGIVFAIEELSRSFEERASGTALTAVILAGVIAIALVGEYTYFGQPFVPESARNISPGMFLVAILGGLSGGSFSLITLAAVRGLPGILGRVQKRRPVIFAAVCGLSVVSVGWFSDGLTYGSGYAAARSILVSGAHLPWFYAPGRALASMLTYLSGIPAGLLAPSLSVGAGVGQFVADIAGEPTAAAFAILGMCGYLSGVTQAPLTSFVIVMEMTTQHEMVLPLMVTAAIATAVSKLLSPPLYRTLARRYES
jgi:chloride channel protein, CIC family